MNLVAFTCKECGKQYDTRADLDFHIGKRHNFGNQGAFGCALCDKRYVCVEDLDFHVARRHGNGASQAGAGDTLSGSRGRDSPLSNSASPGAGKARSATVMSGSGGNLTGVRRLTAPAQRVVEPAATVTEGLHIAVRARNAPESNELSFAVGDKLLVLKVDAAHQRVLACNESRGSVSGWAPIAAIRPATDAEIASRVSGVSTAYVASVSPTLLPDVTVGSAAPASSSNYSTGISQMKFPSADSLPPAGVTPVAVVRNTPSNRVGRVMEATAEPQYGIRPRAPLPVVADQYGAVSPQAADSIDKMAAQFAAPTPVQREGVAAGYSAARPAAPLPVQQHQQQQQQPPPQREGIARGYSSGPAAAAPAYTRPPAISPRGLPVAGAAGEQYGSLQLRPAEEQEYF
jgi:hypothetical protein